MADEQTGIEIVDDVGTVHQFPAGFDPQRAIAIVRGQSTPDPALVAKYGDQVVPPGGIQHEPDTFWSGFGKSLKNQILAGTAGNPYIQGAAHPQQPIDFLSLALPNAEAALTPVSRTIGEIGPQLMGTLRAAGTGAREGSILKAPINAIRGVLAYHEDPSRVMFNRFGVEPYAPNTGGAAAASVPRQGDRIPYGAPAVDVPTPEAVPVSTPAASPTTLSAAQKAELTRKGYTPELIAKIEARAAQDMPVPVASHSPTVSAEARGGQPQYRSIEEAMQPGMGPAEGVTPDVNVQPGTPATIQGRPDLVPVGDEALHNMVRPVPVPSHAPLPVIDQLVPNLDRTPHPLLQPRVDIGAEKVGRAAGLSKEAVRQQTGPILGEAPGEASPILPQKALGNIVDAMRQLPPGPAREAYVARATSGKAQWQIENIRRTLEHLGLLVPLGLSMRNELLNLMSQRSDATAVQPREQ